ncbi:MAG: tripartite tricarboxylate transporter substrate binding protein [Betaproteobacteria bacterium]
MNHKTILTGLNVIYHAIALLFLFFSIALNAQTQNPTNYPFKPVKLIVPFGPGSATDIVARTIAEEMRIELGATFIVENRAGANGFIAAEMVARAPSDGYTLLVTSSTTHSTNQFLFKSLPYDPVKDFTPIGGIIEAYYVLTVSNSLPVNNVTELINWLKNNSNKSSYGWGATVSQLAGSSFLKLTGTAATGIPYKSSPQVVTDLIGGQLTFVVQDITTALAHVKAGRVKALAVTSPNRIAQLSDVATSKELGLQGFNASTYVGMLAPSGTPTFIINRLSNTLLKILANPNIAQRMESCCSARLFVSTPAEFEEYLRRDRINWSEKISAAGLTPE